MTCVIAFSEKEELAGEVAAAADAISSYLKLDAFSIELDVPRNLGGKVILVRSSVPLSNSPELAASALIEVAKQRNAIVTVLGATRFGREVAARLAVKLKAGTLSEVKSLSFDGQRLSGLRSVYAGKCVARVTSSIPCVLTVPAGAYQSRGYIPRIAEELPINSISSKVRHIETQKKPKSSIDLKVASVIISAGRGFKKKEDLELANELARAMGGVLGCSRPLSSDLGWLGEEHHIGLTGIYVRPDLYVAIGISGQLQHVAGIKGSKIIVAINNDKEAPIFSVADYGVVGDLYQVIPAILQELKN